jgi:hypothetical protein
MLTQALQWLDIVGTIVEAVVVLRLLTLKLHRVYLFVTLYWAISLMFDTTAVIMGTGSQASDRLTVYWLFVAAVAFPLAAWDTFEEVNTQISKVRRLYAPRLVSGLFITAILGFVCSLGIDDQVVDGISASTYFVGLFLWLGSASASLVYVWNVRRATRKQGVTYPRNTSVWMLVFMLTFGRSIVECATVVAAPLLAKPATQAMEMVFRTFDLCLGVWCIFKLRGVPSDATSEPEKASL